MRLYLCREFFISKCILLKCRMLVHAENALRYAESCLSQVTKTFKTPRVLTLCLLWRMP